MQSLRNINLSYFFVSVIVYISCGCQQGSKIEYRTVGSYKLKATYSADNILEGKAEVYDLSDRLLNISNYDRGLKNGISIDYNFDGSILDSVTFVYGKEYGYKKYIDSTGKITYKNYYYFGLPYGPEIFYYQGKIIKYLFNDFNKETLVRCNYDSLETLNNVDFFYMKFISTDMIKNEKKVKNLFGFTPLIPRTDQEFAIGITNKSNADQKLFTINSNNFFIDTLLAAPPAGWNYYMSCSVKAKVGVFKKYFIEVFAEKKEP